MRISALRVLAGGFWFGNAVPHIVNGITRRRYPCAAGNGPVQNTLGGMAALALVPVLYGDSHKKLGSRPTLVLTWLGALTSLFMHAHFVDIDKAQEEDRQRPLPGRRPKS
jgi:hypothetical protein